MHFTMNYMRIPEHCKPMRTMHLTAVPAGVH